MSFEAFQNCFSPGDDVKLAEHVSQHPCIYNAEHGLYKDQGVRENVWNQISSELNKNVNECKKRWKNIKDTYNRKKRNMKMGTGSSAKNKPTKWPLADVLSFLEAPSYEREGLSNFSVLNDSQHGEDVVETTSLQGTQEELDANQEKQEEGTKQNKKILSTKNTFKKIKRNDQLVELFNRGNDERKKIMEQLFNTNEEDPVDVFFKSMALTVKRFSPTLKLRAKMDILRIVGELEIENNQTEMTSNQNSAFINCTSSSPSSSQSLQSGISTFNYTTPSNSLVAEDDGSVEESLISTSLLQGHKEKSSTYDDQTFSKGINSGFDQQIWTPQIRQQHEQPIWSPQIVQRNEGQQIWSPYRLNHDDQPQNKEDLS